MSFQLLSNLLLLRIGFKNYINPAKFITTSELFVYTYYVNPIFIKALIFNAYRIFIIYFFALCDFFELIITKDFQKIGNFLKCVDKI